MLTLECCLTIDTLPLLFKSTMKSTVHDSNSLHIYLIQQNFPHDPLVVHPLSALRKPCVVVYSVGFVNVEKRMWIGLIITAGGQ